MDNTIPRPIIPILDKSACPQQKCLWETGQLLLVVRTIMALNLLIWI